MSLKRKLPLCETINFAALPYLIQKRFVDICERKTFKKFAKINSFTRRLSKGRHIIESAVIHFYPNGHYSFTVLCFCNKNNVCCKDFKLVGPDEKISILNKLLILADFKNGNFFQPFPINYCSLRWLTLHVNDIIKFTDLKQMVKSNLKYFNFSGRICFDCTIEDVKALFIVLFLIPEFRFKISTRSSFDGLSREDLISYGTSLYDNELIDDFCVGYISIGFEKEVNSSKICTFHL